MREARNLQLADARDRYLNAHRACGFKGPVWLQQLRARGIGEFERLGFPTTRHEDWKYTDVAPILQLDPGARGGGSLNGMAASGIDHLFLSGIDTHRLIFINGQFAPELSSGGSLGAGVVATNLQSAIDSQSEAVQQGLGHYAVLEGEPFTALNTAFMQDGAFVHIPAHARLEQPIHVVFISTGGQQSTISHPRSLIVAADGGSATVIETYAGPGAGSYFTNAVTEVACGHNVQLDHYKVQLESPGAFHIGTMQVQQGRDTRFTSHSFAFGGKLVRNNANAVLGAEGIECTLNGLVLIADQQLVDNHTIMDHAQPHCVSHELYAHILDGRSRGVFNGKIFVREDAQKTDAKQSNRSLLLSREAEIDTKPQLEINADDVKCTHGATIGQLDEDALFYLRARGIGIEKARDLLTYAFASDIINRVQVEPLRERLEHELLTRLAAGRLADESATAEAIS